MAGISDEFNTLHATHWVAASEIAARMASHLSVRLNDGVVDRRMRSVLKSNPWRFEDCDGIQHACTDISEDVLTSPERSRFIWKRNQGVQLRQKSLSEERWVQRDVVTRTVFVPVPGTEMLRIEVLQRVNQSSEPRSEPTPPHQTPKPEPKVILPAKWFAGAVRDHPQHKGEGEAAYAGRLLGLMRKAPVTKVWEQSTMERRLLDTRKKGAKSRKKPQHSRLRQKL
jgi:hypothetical protein